MTHRRSPLYHLPAAILLAIVFAYPIARTAALSFTHQNLATAFEPQFAGLDNYTRLAVDSRFHSSLRVTALFTVVSVALEFGIGLALALAANRVMRGRSVIRSIFLTPWTLPTAILAVLWAWIFNDQYGAANTLLSALHIDPIPWLARPATAMTAMIVADAWKTTPFIFLVLLAGLQNIPRELYEAIEIDGGGAWAKFRYITWPFLLPFVFVALIFRMIQAFAVFDLVWVMTGGGPGGSTETVSVYAFQTFLRYLDAGYGSAQIVATVLLLAALALLLHWTLLGRHANRL